VASHPLAEDREHWQLSLGGLSGGHSGIQIHQQLGNAIKLLGEYLGEAGDVCVSAFVAGIAHNVIPREGTVIFSTPPGSETRLRRLIDDCCSRWLAYLPPADHGLSLTLEPGAAPAAAPDAAATARLLDLIALFPHGAQAYSLQQPADLVDLSINLAIVRLEDSELYVESSYRFFNADQSRTLQRGVLAIGRAFDLEVSPVAGYPGWQPDFDSPLLALGIATHERLFGSAPEVKAIHAGLECGILKSKKPDVDILSLGPTIRGAHSPAERLLIATVAPFWQLLTALLAEL
jgi:dipeptidase D